jgi:hypothetical protein
MVRGATCHDLLGEGHTTAGYDHELYSNIDIDYGRGGAIDGRGGTIDKCHLIYFNMSPVLGVSFGSSSDASKMHT